MLGIVNFLGLFCTGVSLVSLRKSAKVFWQAEKAEPDEGWSVLAFAAEEALPNTLMCGMLMFIAECVALFMKPMLFTEFVPFTGFTAEVAIIGMIPIALVGMSCTKLTYQAIKHKKLTFHVMLSIARIATATLFLIGVYLYILVSGGDFLSNGNPNYEYQNILGPFSVLTAGVTTVLTIITAYQSARQSQKWGTVNPMLR